MILFIVNFFIVNLIPIKLARSISIGKQEDLDHNTINSDSSGLVFWYTLYMSRQMTPREQKIFGGIFIIVGLFIVGIGLNVVPIDENDLHAPRWILTLAGLVFVIPGIMVLTLGTGKEKLVGIIGGPLMLLIMTIIPGWIALGPGTRECSGTSSFIFSTSRTVADLECRFVFGIGGLLVLLIFIFSIVRLFRKKKNKV